MNKKAFTLVELLAVIVVLAIVLAIAVPGITGIVRNASKSSFESDAKLVLKAIDYQKLKNESFDVTSIDKDTTVSLLGLSNDNYQSLKVVIEDNIPIITIVGQNKWAGFIACGSYRNMKVVESTTDCSSDLIPPVIAVLGDNPVSINVGDTYSDDGATATDNKDGNITGNITISGTINPSVPGTYTITYRVTDSAGNTTTETRTVNVIDVSAPVITMNGSSPVNIEIGSTYIDAGASASDDVDGDITGRIIVTSDVNPNVLGTYTVTYNVSDNVGNAAAPVTRTVNVVDTTSPTVAFGTNGNATWAKSRSTTVTVSDNVSVNISTLKYLWNTSTSTPSEGSFSTTFTNGGTINSPVVTGGYYLWILAKDTSDNTTIIRTNVFNLDNIAPVITMNGSSPVNIYTGSTYTDAGATASDANSGVNGSVVVTGTVNTSTAGTYYIYYNVSDKAGNAATQVTRTVNVVTDYNVLLMHMDGSDNGTAFTDEKGKTVTRNGNTVTKTGIKKFGTASAYFDGTGDYLSIADSTDWLFTGDFTIDFWIRPASVSAEQVICGQEYDGTNYSPISIEIGSNSKPVVAFSTTGNSWANGTGSAYYANTTLTTNTWYHWAIVRSGNTITLYINGTLDKSWSVSGSLFNNPNAFLIGQYRTTGEYPLANGTYIDEFRISKGIARWTANFTPPTVPYTP